MVKCETIKEFTLERFDELQNLVRYNPNKNEKGRVYVRDVFECTEELADYLTGNNAVKEVVVKVIEIIPEKKSETKVANKTTKTKNKKKTKKGE